MQLSFYVRLRSRAAILKTESRKIEMITSAKKYPFGGKVSTIQPIRNPHGVSFCNRRDLGLSLNDYGFASA